MESLAPKRTTTHSCSHDKGDIGERGRDGYPSDRQTGQRKIYWQSKLRVVTRQNRCLTRKRLVQWALVHGQRKEMLVGILIAVTIATMLDARKAEIRQYIILARSRDVIEHHRLNGSSSLVLTATCLSYGSLRLSDFFFRNTPGGQTTRPIFTQNGSNDVDSRTHVPFGVKIEKI